MNFIALGQLLKEHRQKSKLSQAAVVSRLGMSQGYLSKIESGYLRIGFREVILICDMTGLTLERAKAALRGDQ